MYDESDPVARPIGVNSVDLRAVISGDGQYVFYGGPDEPRAANDTNGADDVLGYDVEAGSYFVVSSGADGTLGSGVNRRPETTTAGDVVVFESLASDLLPEDTDSGSDLYVKHVALGGLSLLTSKPKYPRGHYASRLTPDFSKFALMVSGDADSDYDNSHDVFVGSEDGSLQQANMGMGGEPANGSSYVSAISADGAYVVHSSSATNLVPGDVNGVHDIFIFDVSEAVTELVSHAACGAGPCTTPGDGASSSPTISRDGRYVAFQSIAGNVVQPPMSPEYRVFVWDRMTKTTELVSLDVNGSPADGLSFAPTISGDGRFVVFQSTSTDLTDPVGGLFATHTYVRDLVNGTTEKVSILPSGQSTNTRTYANKISDDGRFVTFHTHAKELFVRDRQLATTERISVTIDGTSPDSRPYAGGLSDDGRFVVFSSEASNLVAGDTNSTWDVFLRDIATQTTKIVSLRLDGEQTNTEVFGRLSADGSLISLWVSDPLFAPGVASSGSAYLLPNPFLAHPPIAVDDTFVVDSAGTVAGNVLEGSVSSSADFSGGVGDLAVVALNGLDEDVGHQTELPSGAFLLLDADGSMEYDPAGAFDHLNIGGFLVDEFSYSVEVAGVRDSADVFVTVWGHNNEPTAVDDVFAEVLEDSDIELVQSEFLHNDDAGDAADELRITSVDSSFGGEVTFEGDIVKFKGWPNFSGAATFTYSIEDSGYLSDSAVARFQVVDINDAPIVAASNLLLATQLGMSTVSIDAWAAATTPVESNQKIVGFDVTEHNDDNNILEFPSISVDGTLEVFLTGASGEAFVEVIAYDDGGSKFGGNPVSEPARYKIRTKHGYDVAIEYHDFSDFVTPGSFFAWSFVVSNKGGPVPVTYLSVLEPEALRDISIDWNCTQSVGQSCADVVPSFFGLSADMMMVEGEQMMITGSGIAPIDLPEGEDLTFTIRLTLPYGEVDYGPENNEVIDVDKVALFYGGFE